MARAFEGIEIVSVGFRRISFNAYLVNIYGQHAIAA